MNKNYTFSLLIVTFIIIIILLFSIFCHRFWGWFWHQIHLKHGRVWTRVNGWLSMVWMGSMLMALDGSMDREKVGGISHADIILTWYIKIWLTISLTKFEPFFFFPYKSLIFFFWDMQKFIRRNALHWPQQ